MKNIIISDMKSFFRNPYYMLLTVVFPIIMIFILGNFLEQIQVADEVIGKIKIEYYADNDHTEVERVFEQCASACKDQKDILFQKSRDSKTGIHNINNGKTDAFLLFRDDKFYIYEGTDIYHNQISRSIINGFMESASAYRAVYQVNPESLAEIQYEPGEYTVDKKMKTEMSMMDYYAIAMIIMIAFFSAVFASMAFTEERSTKTMNRLLVLPKNRFLIFTSKVIAMIPQTIFPVFIIMIVSVQCFEASYASGIWENVLLGGLFSMTALMMSAAGVFIGLIIKKYATVILFSVNWLILFLSGCFATEMAVKPLCLFMPPYHILNAAIQITLYGKRKAAIGIMLIELVIILLFVLAGGLIFSRKQEERN